MVDPISQSPSDGPYPSGQATGVSNSFWRPSPQYEVEYGFLTVTQAEKDYGFYAEQRQKRL